MSGAGTTPIGGITPPAGHGTGFQVAPPGKSGLIGALESAVQPPGARSGGAIEDVTAAAGHITPESVAAAATRHYRGEMDDVEQWAARNGYRVRWVQHDGDPRAAVEAWAARTGRRVRWHE
ncbi:hypothetical protein H7K35_02505 [Mycobacterium seoulense]|uniref:hypothetical protein n=1 Tax=Mycobacterium seoulense TaxID=386911 RepID=UPI0021F342B9|nr:hypothetical protein [Mycobacterium seoulense]MCV7436069.1 hypothetical protein [Mycobacterium seoulense]